MSDLYSTKLLRRARWFAERSGVMDIEQFRRQLLQEKRALRTLTQRNRAIALAPQWTSIGPTNVSGRIACVAVDPTDAKFVYAGASGGGVWKSTDAGKSWSPLMWVEECLTIGALAVSQSNPSTIYAATGEWTGGIGLGTDPVLAGIGVFRSDNSGRNWNLCAPFSSRFTSSIALSPTDPNLIYVGGDQGLHKSIDGGLSWFKTGGGSDAILTGPVSDVALDHSTRGRIIAAVDRQGFFESIDYGLSWHPMINGLPQGYDVLGPKISFGPNRHVVAKSGDAVYLSKSNATTFSKLHDLPDKIFFYQWCNVVSSHPSNPQILLAGSNNLYRSSDGGVTWQKVGGYGTSVHPDQQSIAWSSDGRLCYLGNDDGVWRSRDGGATWKRCSEGLIGSHFYVMSTSQTKHRIRRRRNPRW